MKKVFLFFIIVSTISCQDAVNSIQKIAKLQSSFRASSCHINTKSDGITEIELNNPLLISDLEISKERTAAAVAVVTTQIGIANGSNELEIKLTIDNQSESYTFSREQVLTWKESADQAQLYIRVMLSQNDKTLLDLGDPQYMGENALPTIHQLIDSLKKANIAEPMYLVGAQNSVIEGTSDPVHIITFLFDNPNQAKKAIHLFVRSDDDHAIAGINIE